LRPEYQTKPKAERKAVQAALDIALPVPEPAVIGKKAKAEKTKVAPKPLWPSDLLEQTQAVRAAIIALQANGANITAELVAAQFTRAPRAKVEEILRVLEALGFVR
jgi:hypothetical protein